MLVLKYRSPRVLPVCRGEQSDLEVRGVVHHKMRFCKLGGGVGIVQHFHDGLQ